MGARKRDVARDKSCGDEALGRMNELGNDVDCLDCLNLGTSFGVGLGESLLDASVEYSAGERLGEEDGVEEPPRDDSRELLREETRRAGNFGRGRTPSSSSDTAEPWRPSPRLTSVFLHGPT